MLDAMITAIILVCLAITLRTVIRRNGRKLLCMGFEAGWRRELLLGIAIGIVGMLVTVGLIVGLGAAELTPGWIDWRLMALGLIAFGGAAVLEEVVYRAVLLEGAAVLLHSPLIALFASSLLFGVVHLTGSDAASPISVLSNVLGGLMYGIAFLRSKRLWMPIGIHFAWNFVQASVLGFPTSENTTFSGAWFHVTLDATTNLHGGEYGPEGSWCALVGRLVVIGLVWLASVPRTVQRSGVAVVD